LISASLHHVFAAAGICPVGQISIRVGFSTISFFHNDFVCGVGASVAGMGVVTRVIESRDERVDFDVGAGNLLNGVALQAVVVEELADESFVGLVA
jgi:hypothetical protein